MTATITRLHFDRDTKTIHEGAAPAGYGYRYADAFRRADDHPLVSHGQWVISMARHVMGDSDHDAFERAIVERTGETVQKA